MKKILFLALIMSFVYCARQPGIVISVDDNKDILITGTKSQPTPGLNITDGFDPLEPQELVATKTVDQLPAKTSLPALTWLGMWANPTGGKLYKMTAQHFIDSVIVPNWSGEVTGTVTDTTSLSNRINLKLNATDTASLSNRINTKQATLVSATNIKTVNGNTLLGSGDLVIGGGSTDTTSLSNRIDLKSNLQWYIITDYGADPTGVADATADIQQAIDAAELTGGLVYIPRGTFKTTAALTIRESNVVIMGEGESSKILATGNFGHIFDVQPTSTPTTQFNGINGIQFRNFYIESSSTMTSGAAIYAKYSYNFIAQDMRIGTLDFSGDNSVTMRIYDGIYLQYESAAIISGCQIYPTHYGVYFEGNKIPASGVAVGNFYWFGLITGNTNIWGKRNAGSFVTGSAGVYIAGGTGGVQIEQTNISFFDNGVRMTGDNRELFIGHAFSADDCGGAGIYITGQLNILQMTGAWAAGDGRGAQTPNHCLYLDSTVVATDGFESNETRINITGGTFYASENGIYIGAGVVTISGVDIYGNTNSQLTLGGNVVSASITGGRISELIDHSGSDPIIRGVTGLDDANGVGVGGGGGGIGGSIANNQVAIGNGSDIIDGSSAFTFDGTKAVITSSGLSADNTILKVVGSNTSSSNALNANVGVESNMDATTAGATSSFFTYNVNRGSGASIGTVGLSYGGLGTGVKIGIHGRVTDQSTGNKSAGGLFELQSTFGITPPTIATTAALIANNGGVASPVFIAQDNGTPVFTIADGGAITATNDLNISGLINNTTNNTSMYQLRLGTFMTQSYSLNNGFITDNAYYNGSSFTRVAPGYASGFQFYNGQTCIYGVGTGTGDFTPTKQFKIDYDGKFGIGQDIVATPGSFTGATFYHDAATGATGMGTVSPAASSILDITSTTKGVLLPRMTKTQRDAISSPATGLAVYQTDNTPGLRVWNGSNWMRFTETAD